MDQVTLQDRDRYIDEWTRMQIQIWQEQIERLKIVRTGALHQSFGSQIENTVNGTSIRIHFLQYGLYQAKGVGYGYKGGTLPFLDADYRHEHKLDIPRKVGPKWGGYKTSGWPRHARDWYSKKYYMSVKAMVEDMVRIMGDQATHVVCFNLV